MAYIVQLGKYDAINEEDTTTMGYYVRKYLYKPFTMQEYQTTDGQVIKSGKLVVKY